MTKPAPDTLERKKDSLFVDDAELIRRLGVPEKVARDALIALDADSRSGFPKKQALWGQRRYWPAVLAYFDSANGIVSDDAARFATENRHTAPAAASSLPMRAPTRRSA
jgi:hypothetical protein